MSLQPIHGLGFRHFVQLGLLHRTRQVAPHHNRQQAENYHAEEQNRPQAVYKRLVHGLDQLRGALRPRLSSNCSEEMK